MGAGLTWHGEPLTWNGDPIVWGGTMPEIRFLTAAEWGMRWARPPVNEKLLDGEVMIHHTAGGVLDDAAATFRMLNEYAIASKGYSALDYDILVHRNPKTGLITIGEGRGRYMSAATLDFNEQSEAVVLCGYFHPGHNLSRQPHPDELEGLAWGIAWGVELGTISLGARVRGHRDNPAHPGATGCPGDFLMPHLPSVAARANELLAYFPNLPTPPEVLPVDGTFFKLSQGNATLWWTSDGVVAYRIEPIQYEALATAGKIPASIPVLAADKAALMQFHTSGLPALSVR